MGDHEGDRSKARARRPAVECARNMSMNKNKARPLTVCLILLGAIIRVTQAVNFAPVGAMSLFAGARLRGWQAYALPLILMAITDPFLGGYSAVTPLVIGSAALAGSVQFFLITNFGAWLEPRLGYAQTFQGLLSSYTAAIPFFGRTLASDLLYTAVLFGLHAWLSRTVARREQVTLQAA